MNAPAPLSPELDEAVRAHARAILERSDYARYRELSGLASRIVERVAEVLERALDSLRNALPEWLTATWDWLARLWEALRFWEALGGGDDGALSPALWVTGILALAGLTAAVVWALRAASVTRLRAPSESAPGARSEPQAWLGRAAERDLEGRHLEAAHCVQLGALALLVERGWIELARSDPNRTLRERLRTAALPEPERNATVALIDRLEARWFRDRRDDPALYGEWRALYGRLEALGEPR